VLLRLDSLMYGVMAAWVAYYHPTAWLKAKWPLFVAGFVALSLIANPVLPSELMMFTCVFSFSVAALGVACMLPLLSSWRHASGPVAYAVTHISLISYSLYLLHASIINVNIAVPVVQALPVSQPVGAVIGMAILWGVSLPAATLMYKYFEVPVMRLRNRLKTKKPSNLVGTR
jgi:peptidoglycan/LPS O-acetylase OafA/YrhL